MISTPALGAGRGAPPPQMKMNDATMANVMPIAASWLPWRARLGWLRNLRPTMNRTAEVR